MLTREQLQAFADGKLICATHFNWYGWREEKEAEHGFFKGGYFCWMKKPWDEHHAMGKEDPANENE